LIIPESPPGRILQAIRDRQIEVVASWELAEELVEVLRRPRIRRYGIEERDVEDVLFLLAPFLPSVEIEPALRDPRDAPVVAAAIAGRAQAILTGDRDLLDDEELIGWLAERGIQVLTPAAFLE
jgi:putative PIN family toxin of toxin-antitoxin system